MKNTINILKKCRDMLTISSTEFENKYYPYASPACIISEIDKELLANQTCYWTRDRNSTSCQIYTSDCGRTFYSTCKTVCDCGKQISIEKDYGVY